MILIIKHIEIEGAGTLEEFFRQTAWKIKTVELWRRENLPALDECEAIISLGGPMNVYETDKYPFLKREEDFLKEALRKRMPVLGICLGAQLLAKVSAAAVRKAEQKEIGWYKVSLTDEGKRDPFFKGLPLELTVFEWHEDTFEVPRDGVLLAESKSCPNQGFRFGKNAYGLQFHMEVTADMIESWINEYTKEAPLEFDAKKMLIEARKGEEAFRRQANLIYRNFAKIIEASKKMINV